MKKVNKLVLLILIGAVVCFSGILYVGSKYNDNRIDEKIEIVKEYNNKEEIEKYIIDGKKKIPFYSLIKKNNIYIVTYKNFDEILSYEQKIRKTFYDYQADSKISIPHYLNHSEYSSEYLRTFSGRLEFIKLTVGDKYFIAEYSGTLFEVYE